MRNIQPARHNRIIKSANEPAPTTMVQMSPEWLQAGPPEGPSVHSDAWKKILYTAIAGAGVGAGFRGLTSLGEAFRAPKGLEGGGTAKPTIIDVPYLRRRPEEKEKSAGEDRSIQQTIENPGNAFRDTLVNPNAASVSDIPIAWPGALLAGAGGIAGGYKLVDWLTKKRRESIIQDDLESSRKRYHRSLVSQYMEPLAKQALDCDEEDCDADTYYEEEYEEDVEDGPDIENGAVIDEDDLAEYAGDEDIKSDEDLEEMEEGEEKDAAYDLRIGHELELLYREIQEKNANSNAGWWSSTWPKVTGGYLALGAALGAGSGLLTYNMAGKRSPERLVEEAIKAREQEMYSRRPREVFVRPVAVDTTRGKEKEDMTRALAKAQITGI